MKRKEAEKLLAALIFDDLDEASKTELLTYLQTDNELRERLADMRMAVKVASDTVQHGPDPVLGKRRLKSLARLARHGRSRPKIFTAPRMAAAAAIFIIGALALTSLQTAYLAVGSKEEVPLASTWARIEARHEEHERGERVPTYSRGSQDVPTGPSSRSRRTAETPSSEGLYTYRGPEGAGVGAVATGPITTDGRHFAKAKYNLQPDDPQTSIRSGYQQPPSTPGLTEKWDSESSFESKPHSGIPAGRDYSDYSNTRNIADMGYSAVSGGTRMEYSNKGRFVDIGSSDVSGGKMPPTPGDDDSDMDSGGGLYCSYESGLDVVDSLTGQFPGSDYSGMGYGGYGGGMMGGQAVGGAHGMGGYGGMGGYAGGRGGYGGMGRYGTGTMGPSPGSVDSSSRYGVGHSKDSGSDIADAINRSESGDMIVAGGTYYGDIDFKGGKTITLFRGQPVDISADGDGIPATVKYFINNGKAVAFKTDGSIAHKDGGFNARIIDNFNAYSDKTSGPGLVSVVTGEPVAATKPESTTTPPPAKPLSVTPSEPIRNVLGVPGQSGNKLQIEKGSLPRVSLEDIKTGEWWAEMRAYNKNEADFRKADDELGTEAFQYTPEKAKVPALATVRATRRDMIRQGEVTEKEEEVPVDETSADHGAVTIIDCDFEGDIATRTEAQHRIESLLSEADRADVSEHLDNDLTRLGDKKDSRGVPILGDMPLVGGLFRGGERMKRSLSEAEKKLIVDYLNLMKSKPEGKQELNALLAWSDPEAKRIIDQLLKTDEQTAADLGKIPPGGEDEPELPPSSRFKLVPVNPWVMTERDSFSTFALDVDTASYTLCRRYIRGGFLPPAGAVRMEEFINYFNYHYPQRTNPTFAVHAEAAPSPFARKETNLTLLKIGVKARTIGRDQRKAAHLIFVVDASASMGQPDRLPFVQRALDALVNRLAVVDRVSLITCASEARLHLEAVPARERNKIRQAIYAIQPAGPTNLLAGLKLGYATARRSFAPKQINHVVLCSDGVANVGQTEADAVLDEVAADRKQGITITCVGVGYGSYNDVLLEALANRGDGSYMFLDSARQARQVFVRQLAATLQTVAKDARIQVEFNPNRVRRYRLIGYENRDIEDKRFRDDTIDAGEVGSGQCSTALYELELIGQPSADRQADLGTVFVRYRNAETGQIEEISSRLSSAIVRRRSVADAPRFYLAAGAARFAEILRQSEHAQNGNLTDVFRVVEQVSLALPLDRDVRELAELIRKSEHLPRSP